MVLRYRRIFLIVVLLGTVAATVGVLSVKIDFSFDSFYPKDDPEYQYYAQFKQQFTETQNFQIYVAVGPEEGDVFQTSFLTQVEAMFIEISSWEGVDTVISPTQIPFIKRTGIGFSQKPYLRFDSQEAVEKTRERVLTDSSILGTFITHDLSHVCGYIQIEPELFDSRERDVLNQRLRAYMIDSGLPHVLTGIPYIRTRYIETIGFELVLFLGLSLVFIATVLFLTYRNIWGVMVPMLAVVVALIWIVGFMSLTGQSVNLINNLLIPLMFVVGTSDVIHLTTKYLTEVRKGKKREEAMQKTLKEIGLAIFLTSVTTAVGFAALQVSRIEPIRTFGLYAALGVLFTYFITVALLPNVFLHIKSERFGNKKAIENLPLWDRILTQLFHYTGSHPKLIVGITVGILIVCGILIPRVPTDSHLIEDIGKGSPIRASMEFFEEKSYGLRPFELGIHVRSDSAKITDREVLVEMRKLQNWLKERESFSPFFSAATLISEANYRSNFNRKGQRRIPSSQEQIDEYILGIQSQGRDDLLNQVMSEDRKMGRISARLSDLGTEAFNVLYQDLNEFYRTECDTSLFTYRPTGHAFLTEHNLTYVRKSLIGGLSVAFVIVGIIMGLLFRSLRMLLISLIPNMIPLILTGGVMGLFGITLTASTSLVFVIAFGVAVDDTIHFLTRYRLERQQGHDKATALKHTMLGTGKAMIITSLVLMAGFAMLVASDFGGTYNTGLFTGLTVIFALIADLTLLPVLVRWLGE